MSKFWRCPYCTHHATLSQHANMSSCDVPFTIESKDGIFIFHIDYIVCPNPDCLEYCINVNLYRAEEVYGGGPLDKKQCIGEWQLRPAFESQVFPDYIPKVILDDYLEACKIKTLSPKASATLSRRCLQGIIRDFWGIKKARLLDEVEAIKDKVDLLTWDAIDAVRQRLSI